ncbi:MAG: ABC transporter ATP-binding protein, partial [Verrucomicrobiae bacterium]|nr:ABC transporter ATP-binding protein [Verrucomicrobiae bacterium]
TLPWAMARIEIDRVSRLFTAPSGRQVVALKDVTLEILDGELLAVLGPSGSGKSTLLRLVAGLDQPTKGEVRIDGKVVTTIDAKDRDVAMVFQHSGLYPHMTVYQNIAFCLKLRGLSQAEIEHRVNEVCDDLSIAHLLPWVPHTLSAGEQQRVALARAIARRPRVLLLDEPFAHLDIPTRVQMRTYVRKLHRRLGTTIVHVTHDQSEALAMGQRVVVLNSGRVQQTSKPEIIYQNPANLFVASFVGWPPMNMASGVIELHQGTCAVRVTSQGRAVTGAFKLPLPGKYTEIALANLCREVVIGLRPEELSPRVSEQTSESVCVTEATVELVEYAGAQVHVHLDLAGWNCVATWPVSHTPIVGQKVDLKIETDKVRLFDPHTGLELLSSTHHPDKQT